MKGLICLSMVISWFLWSLLEIKISFFTKSFFVIHSQVSSNYRQAISKALRETLEYVGENTDEPAAFKLLEELSSNEEERPVRPVEYIEEQLKKYRQKREEFYEDIKRTTIEQLATARGHVNKDEL